VTSSTDATINNNALYQFGGGMELPVLVEHVEASKKSNFCKNSGK
jgi:hypothetical protein